MRTGSILAAALLLAMPSVAAQNAPDVNTMPLDQLARAIAHTIDGSTARSAGAPLSFDGATSQGTKILIHFTVNDAVIFAKARTGLGKMRDTMVSAFCRDPKKSTPLKRGISLNYSYELADKSDRLEFAIDAAACASLAAVKPATASELSQMASRVINELQTDEEKAQQTQLGVKLQQLNAENGVVEQRFMVVAPAFESFYSANIPQTEAMIKGYVCSKFGDSVRRGLQIHLIYEQETGAKLSEFKIGPSDC